MLSRNEADPSIRHIGFKVGGATLAVTAGLAAGEAQAHNVEQEAFAAFGQNALVKTFDSFSAPASTSSGESLVPGPNGLVSAEASKEVCIQALKTRPKYISAAVTAPRNNGRVTVPGEGTHKVTTRTYGFKFDYSSVIEEFNNAGCSDGYNIGLFFEPQIGDVRKPNSWTNANPYYKRSSWSHKYNANKAEPEDYRFIPSPILNVPPQKGYVLTTPKADLEPVPCPKKARIVVRHGLLKDGLRKIIAIKKVMTKPMKVRQPCKDKSSI